MKVFTLYGTSACHLCEVAHAMLQQQLARGGAFAVEEIDIADDDALFERYGIRIPVLQHPDQRELGWPFSEEDLQAFMGS